MPVFEAVLLSSGGLDSTTLAYWLQESRKTFLPLFFDYGQHCVETEWNTLLKVLPPASGPPRRVNVSDLFRGSKSRMIDEPNLWTDSVSADDLYIPYRTLFFLSAGAAFAQTNGIENLYSGFINSNHAKEVDCSSSYLNGLQTLSDSVGNVRVHFPFRDKSKKEVVELAVQLCVPIGKTYSCQVYSDVPCGVCPNCVDRLGALESAEAAHG